MKYGDQGMLLGSTVASVDESVANREIRLCTLNVQGASRTRAVGIVDWLLGTESNVLVLTEMTVGDGCTEILESLRADGFTVTTAADPGNGKYSTAVVSKGFVVTAVNPPSFDARIVAADLTSAIGTHRIVGVYAVANGMNAESSVRRREFQSRFVQYVADVASPSVCVIGDLNVLEPDHEPRHRFFEAHDYSFYNRLVEAGLVDAYRLGHPAGADHSWVSPIFGAQRLDHTLVGGTVLRVVGCEYYHEPRLDGLTDHSAMLTVLRPSG